MSATQRAGGRNSSSWACLGLAACKARPAIGAHLNHIARSLELNVAHGDGVNVLRYEPGGFYKYHHDYIPHELTVPSEWMRLGPRVLTFMLYLNDVELGGGTRFIKLRRQTAPRAGRALLWANTLSESPLERDHRTSHEALLTRRGIKYVATTWLHAFTAPDGGHCVASDWTDASGLYRPKIPATMRDRGTARARGTGTSRCTGLLSADGSVCCAASCGMCGGGECDRRAGGARACCKAAIKRSSRCCNTKVAPCKLHCLLLAGPSKRVTRSAALRARRG